VELPFVRSETENFWVRCKQALPAEPLGDRYVVRRIGNAPAICESLLQLIAAGQKTGGFSRPEELEAAGLTPHPGDYVILTDYDDRPRCLVQMQECRLLSFRDVGPEHTACESPAARDVDVWRGIHTRYWTPVLAAEGRVFTDDLPVLFQRFRLLYTQPA
jgi:uncharacterized protein YhfF